MYDTSSIVTNMIVENETFQTLIFYICLVFTLLAIFIETCLYSLLRDPSTFEEGEIQITLEKHVQY